MAPGRRNREARDEWRPKRWLAFHLALDGREGGRYPREWYVSQICQEFHCTPEEALRQDALLAMDIMELRSYAKAKAILDSAETEEQAARAPEWGRDKVMQIEAELFGRGE